MTKKTKELRKQPLEQGILMAMRAIDNQIAREMQRTPQEREERGVQKWEPIEKRVESVAALILNAIGDEEIKLDSLIVLARAFSKALQLVIEDLGPEGLGELRSAYCQEALERISNSTHRGLAIIKSDKSDLLN